MDYIGTDDPVTIAHYRAISEAMRIAYDAILGHAPESAERTLAVRKLQEARMWANASIALDGLRYRL